MTNILLIGDPHIRHTSLKDCEDLLKWIELVAEQYKPDLIVNLGDTFDTHSVIRSESLSIVNNHINRIHEMKIPMIMVLGNHDMYKPNSSKYHALEVFKNKPGIIIVDKTMILDGVTYVPYLSNSEDWPDILTKIAITHNTFIGADYGFKLAEQGIPISKISCDIVISGHIHKKQILDSKVHYIGTPYAMSASDADQVKGLSLFNVNSYDFKFIEAPFPMYKTLEQNTKDQLPELDDFNHWIMTLKGPRAEIKSILESKQLNDLKKRCNLTIKTESIDRIKSEKISIVSKDISSMLDEYLQKVYKGNQDKNKIKDIILQNAGVK